METEFLEQMDPLRMTVMTRMMEMWLLIQQLHSHYYYCRQKEKQQQKQRCLSIIFIKNRTEIYSSTKSTLRSRFGRSVLYRHETWSSGRPRPNAVYAIPPAAPFVTCSVRVPDRGRLFDSRPWSGRDPGCHSQGSASSVQNRWMGPHNLLHPPKISTTLESKSTAHRFWANWHGRGRCAVFISFHHLGRLAFMPRVDTKLSRLHLRPVDVVPYHFE